MTFAFPDVSNHEGAISLAGASAAMAKATEGTDFVDTFYPGHEAQAATLGIPFAGYHYLHNGQAVQQAQFALNYIGVHRPTMLDVEVVQGQPDPTMQDVTDFVDAYRAAGGLITLIYLPNWFWHFHWGGPDLTPLKDLGLSLISSNYTKYSETGPGWVPYGGMTPVIWQFADNQPFNGQLVDFNAYQGTVEQLRAVFEGKAQNMAWEYLYYGQKSQAVEYMQFQLQDAGAQGVTVNGTYDDATAAAIVALGLCGGDASGHTFGGTEQIRLDDIRMQRRAGAIAAGTKFSATVVQ